MAIIPRCIIVALLLLHAFPAAAECWWCVFRAAKQRLTPTEIAATQRGARVRMQRQDEPYAFTDYLYSAADESWRVVTPADQQGARTHMRARREAEMQPCEVIPYQPPAVAEAIRLRPHLRVGHAAEEDVGACVEKNGYLWFGLTFYEGEGMDGIGGLGVYSRRTRRVEVHRPEWLRDKSIDHIVHDGRLLWFSVAQHYERGGPTHGLARYDWESRTLQTMRGDDAPCGWDVNDLAVIGDELWVATSIAVSRLELPTNRWRHFVPSADGARLEQRDCRSVYRRLLAAFAEAWRGGESCTPTCEGDQPPEVLAEFHPELAREWLLQQDDRRLSWPELAALARVASGFREFQRALTVSREESRSSLYALEAFSNRKERDPSFRDFVIPLAAEHDQWHLLRYFRADPKVSAALLEAISGPPSLIDSAIDALPWVLGESSIPHLGRIVIETPLDSLENRMRVAAAVQALERAAHLRIHPDGSRVSLPPNSDDPDYAAEEFDAFRPRADVESLRPLVKQWNKWLQARGVR